MQYNTLFGLPMSRRILKITDNLSRSLQKQSMSAAEGQELAALTTHTWRVCAPSLVFQLG